jgi:hypothetical protein
VAPGPRAPAPRGIPRPGACRRCIVPSSCTRTRADRPPSAALLAAPPKAGGEGFASRGQPLQRCTVHVAGALDLNDAAPSSPKPFSARTAAPRQTPTTRYSPVCNPRSPARIIVSAFPAFTSIRSQRSCPPMHAAYHRGPATSAASSFRGSVPATLPQLLRCDCLQALPPLGSPLAIPTTC